MSGADASDAGPIAGCPTPLELERAAEAAVLDPGLAAHLVACRGCREALGEIRDDQAFLASARAALGLERIPGPEATSRSSASAEDRAPLAGALRGYRVLEELRGGGQATVFRAVHEQTQRRAAIKIIRSRSSRARLRIEREAQLVASLRHPNIVAIHDCGELPDGAYALAMELVDGIPLDAWARRLEERTGGSGAFARGAAGATVAAKLRLMAKVCDAIQHAHQRGVIHRDLKPDNILVDAQDEPRVLDFGVARAVELAPTRGITCTGEFAGTLAYASPEQVAGRPQDVDTRTDVYSLGVVLYELLLSCPPYPVEGSVESIVRHIVQTPPTTPARAGAEHGVDGELSTILLTALAKDPDRRYATASALRADLERYLAGEAIDAKRDSRLYVLRKALARNRRLVGAATAAVLAIMLGLTATVVGLMQASRSRERAAAERERSMAEATRSASVAQLMREILPRSDPDFAVDPESPARAAIDGLSVRLDAGLLAGEPVVEAAVRTAMAGVYQECGALPLAEVQLRIAARVLMQAHGDSHAEVASALDRLAALLLERSTVDEAMLHCSRALAMREQLLGADHPDVAGSLGTLALIELRRGDSAAAEKHARRAVELRLARLGPLDAATGESFEILSRVQAARADLSAAQKSATAALKARLVAQSDLSPAVAGALDALAVSLRGADPGRSASLAALAAALRALSVQGVSDASAEVLAELLALKRRLLGEDHPDLSETFSTLAVSQAAGGRLEEAEATLLEALALEERLPGVRALARANLLERLAVVRWKMGSGDVLALLRERLAILREELEGRDDMHLAVVMREMAQWLDWYGLHEESDEMFTEATEFFRRRIGSRHRELAWNLSRHAEFLNRRGEHARALALANEGLAMALAIDDRPTTALELMHLTVADALLGLGRFEECQAVLKSSRQVAEGAPGSEPLAGLLASVHERLGDAWGRPELAAPWRDAAAEWRRTHSRRPW